MRATFVAYYCFSVNKWKWIPAHVDIIMLQDMGAVNAIQQRSLLHRRIQVRVSLTKVKVQGKLWAKNPGQPRCNKRFWIYHSFKFRHHSLWNSSSWRKSLVGNNEMTILQVPGTILMNVKPLVLVKIEHRCIWRRRGSFGIVYTTW